MKPTLARVLIERGILSKGTIVEAYYSARGISGQCDAAVRESFKITGAQAVGEWVFFNVLSSNNENHRIRCDYVIAVDGMPINRLAESHMLTEDGEIAPAITRRGRRKKADDDLDGEHDA